MENKFLKFGDEFPERHMEKCNRDIFKGRKGLFFSDEFPKEESHQVRELKLINFPMFFNLMEWELDGYLQGDKINRKQPVTLEFFDEAVWIGESENDHDGKIFAHVYAIRKEVKESIGPCDDGFIRWKPRVKENRKVLILKRK